MHQQTNNNKRIIKNTLMLYVRMLISMVISLYTARVILGSLGVEDYGIYSVIGGFVTSLSIFTSALAVSISRFITYGLGNGNIIEQKQIFSTSIFIQLVVVVVILLIAETAGLWFMNTKLVIPENRMFAANWVYQFSVISFLVSIIGIPYSAAITAHEKMSAYAFIGLIDAFVKLVIAFTINISPIDRLIWYGVLLMFSTVGIQGLFMVYCLRNFQECKCCLKPNHLKLSKMLGFSGWTVLGGIAPIIRDQGGTIILNIFFGPVVNAARGIANQVCVTINSFVVNFQSAVNPQIIKNYASGDYGNLKQLVFASSKYSCYILLVLAIPVAINLSYLLKLWLQEYPVHTESFIFLVLIFNVFEAMSNPFITAAVAVGRMKKYQLRVAPLVIMNLPISYIALKHGCIPEIVFIISIAISILTLFVRLHFLATYVSIDIFDFLKDVLIRVSITSVVAYTIPYYVNLFFDASFFSFVFISFFSVVISFMIILFVGCTEVERDIIIKIIKAKTSRHEVY